MEEKGRESWWRREEIREQLELSCCWVCLHWAEPWGRGRPITHPIHPSTQLNHFFNSFLLSFNQSNQFHFVNWWLMKKREKNEADRPPQEQQHIQFKSTKLMELNCWTVPLGPQCAQQIKSKSIFPLGREDWIWFVLLMRGGCPHSLTNKFTNLSYL